MSDAKFDSVILNELAAQDSFDYLDRFLDDLRCTTTVEGVLPDRVQNPADSQEHSTGRQLIERSGFHGQQRRMFGMRTQDTETNFNFLCSSRNQRRPDQRAS